MASPTKPFLLKCAIDIRTVPVTAYRLPSDGRQWKHVCAQRQRLTKELALYANPDGSSIRVAVETLAQTLGLSRRAIMYRLDDLRTLGFITDGKLAGFKGTRWRTLNVAAITAAADVQSTPDVQTSNLTDVQTTAPQMCNLGATDVQSTQPSCAILGTETPEDCTQPPLLPPNVPPSLPPCAPKNGAGGVGVEEEKQKLWQEWKKKGWV
jgi:hypothetical protein